MAKNSQPNAQLPPSDEEFTLAVEEDEVMQEILQAMASRVCDYCESGISWLDPAELRKRNPEPFDELVTRDLIEPDHVIMAWACDSCENFSLIGEDFEVQWMDSALECSQCGSSKVELVDPAQTVHIDRQHYLDSKKLLGVAVLLNSTAEHCLDCGSVAYIPGPEVPRF
ncbi:hypothetical protein [Tessaracoccus massiliensis]|uniref:hypothetical protein n=1 Tax=Tessaracoccus massiliensis TaxID=1522311 RepID=UPI00058B1DB0|nr:hypothetical protein [Tessaracoccus massiliensis]